MQAVTFHTTGTTKNTARPPSHPSTKSNAQSPALKGRASVAPQKPSRAPAPTHPVVVFRPLQPLQTHFGVWLDNSREPNTRIRVSVGADGQSIELVMMKLGILHGAEVSTKQTFNITSATDNILDVMAYEFGLHAQDGRELLNQLATLKDATDFFGWVSRSDDVRVQANAATRQRVGENAKQRDDRVLAAVRAQARVAKSTTHLSRDHGLYLDEADANAENTPPHQENIRQGLMALSIAPSEHTPASPVMRVARPLAAPVTKDSVPPAATA